MQRADDVVTFCTRGQRMRGLMPGALRLMTDPAQVHACACFEAV